MAAHALGDRVGEAIDVFLKDKLEAAAGVKQPLVQFAKTHPGVRVMDGRFMAIEQAMGTPKGREAGARYLRQFVEEMKASGFVARGLEKSGQGDATVARIAAAAQRAGLEPAYQTVRPGLLEGRGK